MIRKCTERDRAALMEYLKDEAVYNTFLLADIADFGFEQDFQTVYVEETDGIDGVYLLFYQTLILYSRENRINREFLTRLFQNFTPDVVMGKMECVKMAAELLPGYALSGKPLYLLSQPEKLPAPSPAVEKAALSDADDIFAFLQTIPEIRGLYTSKQMICDRIEKNTGVHYLIRENGRIISHANSTAQSSLTTMIGGVATAKDTRNRSHAGSIVSRLCRDILANEKTPCLFCDNPEAQKLFCKIGFSPVGQWATLVRG